LGIRLSIANQGPPLPPDMQGRLFDSMVSVRTEQSRDEPHLGLGLYIVRLIAEFHGGEARAENLADARGVRFLVRVPR
jgi:two-component system, OmpR family, sensor histidine kinase ChvG